jgi:hypothetical protein
VQDPRLPAIKDLCAALKEFVLKSMEKGTRLRGSHVHRARLSDTKIERLRTIGLHTRFRGPKLAAAMRAFYRVEYRKTRKKWTAWIAEGNSSARKMLDAYFDAIYPAIFGKSGAMRYPNRLKF